MAILVGTNAVADRYKQSVIGKGSSADCLSMGNDSTYMPVNQISKFQIYIEIKLILHQRCIITITE